MHRIILVVTYLIIVATLAAPASADSTGAIRGRVWDPFANAPAAHVLVSVQSATQHAQTYSDQAGYYSIIGLAPELQAHITFAKEGFFFTRVGIVPICVGQTLHMNVEMYSRMIMLRPLSVNAGRRDYQAASTQSVVNPDPFATAWPSQFC